MEAPEPEVKVPVRTRLVPVAAPMSGVTSAGVFAKTRAPLPVSSVTAVFRFADDGVARKVATPAAGVVVPRVVTPRTVSIAAVFADARSESTFADVVNSARPFVVEDAGRRGTTRPKDYEVAVDVQEKGFA